MAADLTGIKKKVAYQRALELTQQDHKNKLKNLPLS